MTDIIRCPVDGCDKEWPDTKGHNGGQQKRFIHIYDHDDVSRTLPFKLIERL